MLTGTVVVFTDDSRRWAVSSVHWRQRGRAPHGNCGHISVCKKVCSDPAAIYVRGKIRQPPYSFSF